VSYVPSLNPLTFDSLASIAQNTATTLESIPQCFVVFLCKRRISSVLDPNRGYISSLYPIASAQEPRESAREPVTRVLLVETTPNSWVRYCVVVVIPGLCKWDAISGGVPNKSASQILIRSITRPGSNLSNTRIIPRI